MLQDKIEYEHSAKIFKSLKATKNQSASCSFSVYSNDNYTHTSSLLQLWICPKAMEMYTNITIQLINTVPISLLLSRLISSSILRSAENDIVKFGLSQFFKKLINLKKKSHTLKDKTFCIRNTQKSVEGKFKSSVWYKSTLWPDSTLRHPPHF